MTAMITSDTTVYAEALFMAAIESNATEAIYSDMNTALDAIRQAPEYINLIDTPALDREEKHGLIECAFGSAHELTINLIKLLSDKNSFYFFDKIARDFNKLYDEHNNIARGEAISARPLTDDQMNTLTQKLQTQLNKRVILTNTVDPEILGGVRLNVESVQIDGSLRRRLCEVEKILKNTVI